MLVSKEIIIKGKVQGVGFRYFVFQVAKQNDIKGFVRNSMFKNNVVEVCCQGNEQDVSIFIEKIKKGPTLSRVESITINKISKELFDDFIIK